MPFPEEFEGGIKEMLEETDLTTEPYAGLEDLADRGSTAIKIKGGGEGEGESALALKYGYSQPISQISRMTEKLYGFARDAKVESHLEKTAIMGVFALNDLLFDAACVNRQARYEDAEADASRWEKLIAADRIKETKEDSDDKTEDKADDKADDVHSLLTRWSEAHAFMQQVGIVEEQRGIDAVVHLREDYMAKKQQRDDAEMGASRLPAAWNMFFWCRVQQYKIMRERSYDLSMGYPVVDYTELKRKIADGGNIHDLVEQMPWAYLEGYQRLTASLMDGEAHRTTLISLYAQTHPAQMPQMPPQMQGYWPPPPPVNGHNPDGEEGGEEKDNRQALFNKWFGRNGSSPEQPKPRRRSRTARR